MPEDTFFTIFSIWLPQSRLSSMVNPRDLAVATWVTRKSLIASVGETVTVLSLCLDPINMNSVLVIFRVSLFALSQLWTFSKSSFKHVKKLWILLLAYVRWVSSAHTRGSQFYRQLGRSFIYNRNNNGPKIVPWGTPQLKEQLLERRPLMEHICVRSSKYDWHHWRAIPLIPWRLSFDKRISWSTVSKAFFQSRNTTALILPRSILYAQVA